MSSLTLLLVVGERVCVCCPVAMRNSVGLGSSKAIAVGNRDPESKESS
jgi:hypothetical protein